MRQHWMLTTKFWIMHKKIKIGILGSRGIPNQYGGFEECAEKLALRLVEKGHEVSVYTEKQHKLKERNWNGINRILIKNPEDKLGTFGQFIYDLNCNLDSRKNEFDVVLHLGYTSDSIWNWLWPKKSIHIVNMDGLEWLRSKYSKPVRRFLKYAEKLAAVHANWLVADSIPIEDYLKENYNKKVSHIAYGADIPATLSENIPESFGLKKRGYDLIVARIIPDNHIEMILQAKELAVDKTPLFILCNENAFKNHLAEKYQHLDHVTFYGPVYEKEKVNSLRYYCRYYLHGHSAGGTNPSLLEAMACSSPVVAHGNKFNKAVLGKDAQFFSSVKELAIIFEQFDSDKINNQIRNNLSKIHRKYNWDLVTEKYEQLFYEAIHSR